MESEPSAIGGGRSGGRISRGEALPDFCLPDVHRRDWRRQDLLGSHVVLFCFSSW